MYRITYTERFSRQYLKLTKRDKELERRIDKIIDILSENPYEITLRTHKVGHEPGIGDLWSSRITGDIRIIWVKDSSDNLVLILVKIGGHDDV